MTTRGYWREDDGSQITAADAWDVWAGHAYTLLIGVARTYRALMIYGDLAEGVQKESGIRTSSPFRHWIGKVLYRVVEEGYRRGDPPLTALVVHRTDGKVGEGYKAVLEVAGEPAISDELEREYHAANARLACYRHFGADFPADGGTPALAPELERTVARRRPPAVTPPRTCPRCSLQLPATGICDYCA